MLPTLKKYFWIPVLLFAFVMASLSKGGFSKRGKGHTFGLRPMGSDVSLAKKLSKMERMMKNNLTQMNGELGKMWKLVETGKSKGKKTINTISYPDGYMVLPSGHVVIPEKDRFPVKGLRTKDGRTFYKDGKGNLYSIDKNGKITEYGKKELYTDGDKVYVGDKPVGELDSYKTDFAVDDDGNIYIDENGNIAAITRDGIRKVLGKSGGMDITGKNLELQAESVDIPVGYVNEIVTSDGRRFRINEKGEVVEIKDNKVAANYGQGKIIVDKDGNVFIQTAKGKTPVGKIAQKGILLKDGSRVYKNDKGEVVLITADGEVKRLGKGDIEIKNGKVFIRKENGEIRPLGEFDSTFTVIPSGDSDILMTENGIGIVSGGAYKEVEGNSLEITGEKVNYPHLIQPGEIIKTADGYTYYKNKKGELIEIDPEGKVRNLGKTDVTYDGKNLIFTDKGKRREKKVLSIVKNKAAIPASGANKIFKTARRLGVGEIVVTLLGNTYVVVGRGMVMKVDKNKNVDRFIGELFLQNGWLFINTPKGYRMEKVVSQKLKEDSFLRTSKGDIFYQGKDKLYKKQSNKVTDVGAVEIKGNQVTINGVPVGGIKETQSSKRVGEGEKYVPKTGQKKKGYIGASLEGDELIVKVGNKHITTTIPSVTPVRKKKKQERVDKVSTRFADMRKELNGKRKRKNNHNNEEKMAKRSKVQLVSYGVPNFSFDEDEEYDGFGNRKGITIPMATLIYAVADFGHTAPTEGKGEAKAGFRILNNPVLPSGEILPMRGGWVRAKAKGNYNNESAEYDTDKVIFYDYEENGNFEGSLLSNVISADDYRNGLRGVVISKRDKVMMEILQAEFIRGPINFLDKAANPITFGNQPTLSITDATTAGAIGGLMEAGEEYIKFKTENAKKLFAEIGIKPGQKVIIQVWETTTLKRLRT